jgi:hypothetical protein
MLPKTTRFLPLIVFSFCMLMAAIVEGQTQDAGLWTSVNFETKLVKNVSATVSEELRFNENITELGAAFTDVGLNYKLNKHFQFAVNYRFTQRHRTDNYYSFRHRFYVDIKYSKKFKPFEFSFRTRLQDQYADIGRAADGGVPEYYLRNKLSMKWDLNKPYTPYISLELFSLLNYPRSYAFNGMRTAAGVEYAFSKHHKVDLYYMIQKELNVSQPETDFIVGLGYYYKL